MDRDTMRVFYAPKDKKPKAIDHLGDAYRIAMAELRIAELEIQLEEERNRNSELTQDLLRALDAADWSEA